MSGNDHCTKNTLNFVYFWLIPCFFEITSNMCSHLSNSQGGGNKRGGGAKVAKSINVEDGISEEGGIF